MQPNSTACPRYTDEALAWEYDQRNQDLSPAEIAWYSKYAQIADGPILELACGSGRLLIPLVQAGYPIDGADYSKAMLARLRAKLRTLNPRRSPHLSCFDMVNFTTEHRYAMIFVGYNSLQYVETKEGILRCFRNVNDSLSEGGYFLFMVQRLNLSLYQEGKKQELDWMEQPIVHSNGMAIGSKFITYLDPSGRTIIKDRTYRITQPDGSNKMIECQTVSPVLEVSDYRGMLNQVGFRTKVYSGYLEETESENAKTLCFVCQKAKE